MVQILKPNGRKGGTIHERHYEVIKRFILMNIKYKTGIELGDLLQTLSVCEIEINTFELPWLILQVKQDLQTRGLIRMYRPPEKRAASAMKLTKMGLKEINQCAKSKF